MNNKEQRILLYFITISCSGFIFILFKSWVSEDAFITARVIDNFINGHGLVWNIGERVQVYTHPLWMILHIPFYFITNEFFYTTIFISLTLSFIIFFLISKNFLPSRNINIFLVLSFLFLSRSVSDFFTSGLETPLTYLLLLLFVLQVNKNEINWYKIGILSGLLMLNRMDNILLVIPCLIYILYNNTNIKNLMKFSIGSSLFFIWIIFSLLYYGFIFPNTKYAKLDTGMDFSEQIQQGIGYFITLINYDLTSIFIILISLFIIIKSKKLLLNLSLFSGVILYSLYVIYIGGDYMIGRFFAPAIFLSISITSIILQQLDISKKSFIIIFTILISSFLFSQIQIMKSPNVLTKPFDAKYFIDIKTKTHDERGWSWETNHLIKGNLINRTKIVIDHPFAKKGLLFNKRADRLKSCNNMPCFYTDYFAIGMTGYYAGAKVHIIDNFAITDAFLARMPMTSPNGHKWAGHYYREIPKGYMKALQKNDFSKMDNKLAEYYKIMKTIISGDLLNKQRISNIIDINIGKFDYILENIKKIK